MIGRVPRFTKANWFEIARLAVSPHFAVSALIRLLALPVLLGVLAVGVAGCGGGGGSGVAGSGGPGNGTGGGGGDEDDDDSDEASPCEGAQDVMFVEVTNDLGLCYESDPPDYSIVPQEDGGPSFVLTSGGLTLSEVDENDTLFMYVTRGAGLPGQLFEHDGETFVESDDRRGIDPNGFEHSSYFLDIDGDGDKDFVSIQYGGQIEVFENDGANNFALITESIGLRGTRATEGLTAGDFDLDGDLDLFFTHWGSAFSANRPITEYLWRNRGDGSFEDFSDVVALDQANDLGIVNEYSFTPIFTDLNADGYPDMVIASDFETSQVLMNRGGQLFENTTTEAIDDENGMGADVGDVDNDGDYDWFVTSISDGSAINDPEYLDEESGQSGNRLYENTDGGGEFEDISESGGVRQGYWGWGACFADFDNNGRLDIFHTNGWGDELPDPSRLFMSVGQNVWQEESQQRGIFHDAQGRAVICTDYNDDGHVDIFIGNHALAPTVYKNTGDTDEDADNHYLKVRLDGLAGNPEGIGARIEVETANAIQVREMRDAAGFLSQAPAEVHFGLAEADTVTRVSVKWPNLDNTTSELFGVAVDQTITIEQPEPSRPSVVVMHGGGSGAYHPGTEVTITAKETREHYFFSHWSVTGDVELADRFAFTTTFVMPDESISIDARFLPGVPTDVDVSPMRRWNEVLLQAIRLDFARPTVHARNLFHISAAMYDAWAATDDTASPWLLGRSQADFACDFDAEMSDSSDGAKIEAASFAAYRLMAHRFESSPGFSYVQRDLKAIMEFLELDPEFETRDVDVDVPATLGNHIGWCYIQMGLGDGAYEDRSYENTHYEPVNLPIDPHGFGNDDLEDFNRWQPITLPQFLDQSGNRTSSTPDFLSAEWGDVWPFSLRESDLEEFVREDGSYNVYLDPGVPPQHGESTQDLYQWGFSLVAIWSAHLDHNDGVEWDISPASLGNIDIDDFPTDFEDYDNFYDKIEGGDIGQGYELNPFTQQPYEPQHVPRGDYARVLAEFWADGPESETPPGHWFVILNTVNDHPELERRLEGEGPELSMLEWDIKAYFALGGAMHDSAIAAWGAKGWYDYIRPLSAIRGMASVGQSSDPNDLSYDPAGIPLEDGFIELVREGDPLAGEEDEHVGRIKIKAWLGPTQIYDTSTDFAGVDWMLAEEWWPYQRPSFVTPPFAGYVSGHSTYSRAAADTLTRLTGDRFFPGGMSGFEVAANDFLVFEKGPSVSMTLQWATYQDASDQCSLSRIWGGIHPPADDLPGRLLGERVADRANEVAFDLFNGVVED